MVKKKRKKKSKYRPIKQKTGQSIGTKDDVQNALDIVRHAIGEPLKKSSR